MKRTNTQKNSIIEVKKQDFFYTWHEDCLLGVLHWCQEHLFQRATLVCKHWHSLIKDETNQKNLLFRPVQDTHIYLQRRTGDLRLCRNICEEICINSSVNQNDIDYFKAKDNGIVKEIVTSETMLEVFLDPFGGAHQDCQRVVTSAWKGENNLVEKDLRRLRDHIIDLMNLMFNFLTEQNMNQGYGVLIPFLLQKLLPLLDEVAKNKIVDTLRMVLRGEKSELAMRVMQEEAPSFYTLLESVYNSDSLDVKKNANAALGFMALNLSNQHQHAPWNFFLDKIYDNVEQREYFFEIIQNILKDGFYDKIDLGCRIVYLLELENAFFMQCLKDNAGKFIFLLEELVYQNVKLMNHSAIRGLHAIALTQDLNLDDELKERIRLNLQGFLKIEVSFCHKEIKGSERFHLINQEFIDLFFKSEFFRNSLLDALLRGTSTNIDDFYIKIIKNLIGGEEVENNDVLKLEKNINIIVINMLMQASKKKLEFYMPYILEGLLSHFTDDGVISILCVFKLNLHKNHVVQNIEINFNMYSRIFKLLSENPSYQVKTNAITTIALMALNISENYRNRSWTLFLTSISGKQMLQFISRVISKSVDGVSLNFAEKIRELLLKNCTSFIQFFSENSDEMFTFLNYQLSFIKRIDIKVDVGLALIVIATNQFIENNEENKRKVKQVLLQQLKWTDNLLIEIEKKISFLKDLGHFQGTNFEEDTKIFIEELVQK